MKYVVLVYLLLIVCAGFPGLDKSVYVSASNLSKIDSKQSENVDKNNNTLLENNETDLSTLPSVMPSPSASTQQNQNSDSMDQPKTETETEKNDWEDGESVRVDMTPPRTYLTAVTPLALNINGSFECLCEEEFIGNLSFDNSEGLNQTLLKTENLNQTTYNWIDPIMQGNLVYTHKDDSNSMDILFNKPAKFMHENSTFPWLQSEWDIRSFYTFSAMLELTTSSNFENGEVQLGLSLYDLVQASYGIGEQDQNLYWSSDYIASKYYVSILIYDYYNDIWESAFTRTPSTWDFTNGPGSAHKDCAYNALPSVNNCFYYTRNYESDIAFSYDLDNVESNKLSIIVFATSNFEVGAYVEANETICPQCSGMENNNGLTRRSSALKINYAWIDYSITNNQLRSEKRKLPDSDHFEHRLFIQNFMFGTQFTIYAPLDWNYSYIAPNATISLSSNDYVITNTIPVTYEIHFLSGSGFGRDYRREKQILAITDKTNTYCADGSFENNYLDAYFPSANPFDSKSLNYTIVKDGIASLKLQDSNSDHDKIMFYLPYGEYYFSFDLYIESITAGNTISIAYYTSSWIWIILFNASTGITNRWMHFTYFMKPTASSSSMDIQIEFSSFVGTVYFDNIHIYQVSTTIKSQIDEKSDSYSQFSSTFNYLTNYDLYPAKNENATLYLYDRTTQTQIDFYTAITDNNGLITWNWYGKLDMKEYELRAIAWNSWWSGGDGLLTYLDRDFTESANTGDFSAHNLSPYIESFNSTDTTNGRYSFQIDAIISGAGDNGFYFNPTSASFDLTYADYLVFSIKTNVTKYFSQIFMFFTGGGYTHTLMSKPLTAGSWLTIIKPIKTYTGSSGSLIWADTTSFRFDMDYVSAGTKIQLRFDGLRAIQTQKLYFTPNIVSGSDYAKNILLDEWDFSEGDIEGFSAFGTTYTVSVSNGCFIANVNRTGSEPFFRSGSIAFDPNYYTVVDFRFRLNISLTSVYFNFRNWGGAMISQKIISTTANVWLRLSLTMSSATGNEVYFYFSGTQNIAYTLSLDYMRILHREVFSGNHWEFNTEIASTASTSTLFEAWVLYTSGGSTIKETNGNLFMITGTYAFAGIQTFSISTTLENFDQYPSMTKAILYIKTNSNSVPMRFSTLTSAGVTLDYTSFTSSTSYQTVVLSLTQDFNYIRIQKYNSATAINLYIDYIRFVSATPQNLYQTDNSFLISNERQITYKIWSDNIFQGFFFSNSLIPKNLTAGTHTFRYEAVLDSINDVIVPSVVYEYRLQITTANYETQDVKGTDINVNYGNLISDVLLPNLPFLFIIIIIMLGFSIIYPIYKRR